MLFIDALAGSLILPVLPELFLNDELGLINGKTYLSKEMLYSCVLASFPLASLFGMPILGALSDKYGGKKIILWGLGSLTLNYLIIILAILIHNVWLFLFNIFLSGFLSGTYAVGNAIISNLYDNKEERIAKFKLPILASTLGMIIGPGLSVFSRNSLFSNILVIPFVTAFILSGINFILLPKNLKNIQQNFIAVG